MTLDEAIKRLRELKEDVPEPLRLPTEDEVTKVEKRLRVTFHPDYRRYLLEASDVVFGALEPATITEPDSHTDLIAMRKDARELDVPKDLLPICEDNGDYYCINPVGEIVFFSQDGETEESWKDLATWIEEVWIGESE